jgi:hypothetical protein
LFDDFVVPGCYYDFKDPFLPYLFGFSDDSRLDSTAALQLDPETGEASPSSGEDSSQVTDQTGYWTPDSVLDGIDPALLSGSYLRPAPAASLSPPLPSFTMPASSQSASNAPAQIAPRSDEKPSSKRQRDEDEPDENAKRIKTGEQFHCLWENCAETYDDIADLRSHVRNHAGQAMRCGWRNCDRAPEPAALIK